MTTKVNEQARDKLIEAQIRKLMALHEVDQRIDQVEKAKKEATAEFAEELKQLRGERTSIMRAITNLDQAELEFSRGKHDGA